MTTNQMSDRVSSAEELANAVRAFAGELRDVPESADKGTLLEVLEATQSALAEAYDVLVQGYWHGDPGGHRPQAGGGGVTVLANPSRLRAGLALREASQYSRDAASALDRARTADEVAQWFDEISVDDDA